MAAWDKMEYLLLAIIWFGNPHGTEINELKQWLIYDLGCMVGYNIMS